MALGILMDDPSSEVTDLYYRVINVVNFFLENAACLTFEALKEFDPSVEKIAKNMRMLANVLKELAGDSYEDEKMALNAFQCCLTMERLADVVAAGDGQDLENLMHELEMHARVP